jgi:hypothetical protein
MHIECADKRLLAMPWVGATPACLPQNTSLCSVVGLNISAGARDKKLVVLQVVI